MNEAIGYVRVSSEEQADSGLGLQAQRQRIVAFCDMKGLRLAEVYEDAGVSGGKPLASRPSGSRLLSAARRGKVVVIVAKLDRLFRSVEDAASRFQTWMHGGSHEVLDFVRRLECDWRWWDNTPIQRPLVSIVAVRSSDEFEAARPDKGVMIRVRCAWENTTQGFPKKPLTELVKLIVDGAVVTPKRMAKKRPRGAAYVDYYHQFHLPEPAPGRHRVQAVVRALENKEESSRSIEFTIGAE